MTSTATIFATVSLLAAFFPAVALAQIKITEIMYDAPGGDTGHEWLEVTNTGSEVLDIGKYKLAESGTNHSLKAVLGSSALAPGASAIIASDALKFEADYPSYAGALFDSAFSLSNTGELLAIKNASSTVLDQVSYAAATEANGTGGSLNEKDGAWIVAMASPGIYPSPLTPVPKKPAATGKSASKKSASTSPSKTAKTNAVKNSATAAAPSFFDHSSQAASAALPDIPTSWLIGGGLVAVMLAGVAGIFFLRAGKPETIPSAEEFNIE